MDPTTHTDPLAGIFPAASAPRFAGLDWMPWVSCVYHRANQDFDDDQGIAFVAGTLHTRRALSFDRPEKLTELLDKPTLNFLAGWGISNLALRRQDVMDMVEGHTRVLESFRAGVMYAIGVLRGVRVPEGVDVGDCEGVADALEGFAHEQFICLTREVERLEGVVLMQNIDIAARGGDSTEGASEDGRASGDEGEMMGAEEEDQSMGGVEDQRETATPGDEEPAPKRISKRARQRKAKKAKKAAEREAREAKEAEEAEEAEVEADNTPTE